MAEFKRRMRFVLKIDYRNYEPDIDDFAPPVSWVLMPGLLEKRTFAVEVRPFFLARRKSVHVIKGLSRRAARAARLLVSW
jgi:hypothetical protein